MMKLIQLYLLLVPIFCESGVEALTAIEPASLVSFLSPTMWDPSLIIVIVGSVVASLLVVAVYLMFFYRCSERDLTHTEWPCTCSQANIPPEVLRTFPIISYSSINHHRGETIPLECAVCVTDFTLHDTLRVIPHCNHVFHLPCIDAWLSTNLTCPVCRANLLLPHHHVLISVNDEFDSARSGLEVDGEMVRQGKLMRSNSTGHSFVEEGVCVERYTLRLPEDVRRRRSILEDKVMQRSASFNAAETSMKGLCCSDGEGSSTDWRNRVDKNLS